MCTNCDMVQDNEYGEDGYRVKTGSDRRYHLAWEQLKRQIYTRPA